MKEIRKKNNIKQNDLAKQVNVSQALVSQWENKTREPNCQTIIRLSEIFKCSIEEIVRCFAN